MLPDLAEIARLRKSMGLTQSQLANLSGVSQSAVAKIERGQMAPSYDLARRILDALNRELGKAEKETSVSKVRTRAVHSIGPEATLQEAAEIMRHHGFSQLPVLRDGKNLGHVTEGTVSRLILSGRKPKDLVSIRAREVMEVPLPTVDTDAPVSVVAALLQHYPAVLVVEDGEIAGIVAKSDLMKLL